MLCLPGAELVVFHPKAATLRAHCALFCWVFGTPDLEQLGCNPAAQLGPRDVGISSDHSRPPPALQGKEKKDLADL